MRGMLPVAVSRARPRAKPARQSDVSLFAAFVSRRARALDALVPLAAVQAAGIVCGIIGVRWSSSVIPPDVLGFYGLLLSTTQLALGVTHQGFVRHVQRFWTPSLPLRAYVAQVAGGFAVPTAWMAAALALVLGGLYAIASVPVGLGTLAWAIGVNMMIVVAVCAQTGLQAENRYWAAFAISAVGSATRSFVPPLLAMLLGATLFWLEAGFFFHVSAQVVLAALLLRNAWRRPGTLPEDNGESLARTVRALAGAGLCGWLAAAAPRWIAATVLTPEATGYFVLAGNLTLVVPASFGAIALNRSFPGLFGAAREGADPRALLRMTDRTVAAVLVGSQLSLLVLAWLSPVLVGTVVSTRYASSMDWLLATGGAALAATTTQFYHNVLLAKQREPDCVKLSIASAAFRLVAMAAAATWGIGAFRVVLIALPWLTVALERVYTQRLTSARARGCMSRRCCAAATRRHDLRR
jgi:hypothetical protein